jgi:hypothetical protein
MGKGTPRRSPLDGLRKEVDVPIDGVGALDLAVRRVDQAAGDL